MTVTGTPPATDPPATKTAATRDPRTFWRVAVALALPAGPLLVTVSRALMPYWTNQDRAAVVAGIAAAPGRMELLNWIGLIIIPAMLITVLGLGYLARRGSPVLAAIGAISGFFAYGMLRSSGNTDHLLWVMSTHGYAPEEMATLAVLTENTPMAAVATAGWVVVHILGMVVAAMALRRARILPVWAAIGLAISQPVHLVAAVILPSRALDVLGGWGLTTVICGYLAVRVLRLDNQEWDLPVVSAPVVSAPLR